MYTYKDSLKWCVVAQGAQTQPDGGSECDTQVPLERASPPCVNTAGCRNENRFSRARNFDRKV